MNTVTLGVRGLDDSLETFRKVWKTGKGEPAARINFATPELLWQVLTAKRWEILKAMCGRGPLSIREIARRTNRDVKAVHGDVKVLAAAGVLDKTESGGAVFPYDAVHVDFVLKAA
ncbi:MAG: DNA-binding protein [Rhodospirillales bacterium]|nr:DNA-binding protein [Rhodospirillales bacterium]